MKVIKGDKILKVTGKAYKVVYKDLGYRPVLQLYNRDTKEPREEVFVNDEGVVEPIKNSDKEVVAIEDITKDEIIKKLKEKEIEHNPRDKKEVLYNLLVEGEQS